MSRPDLVSVVVPTFNAAPTLAEALDSVLNQSHLALEVLIIDDGSTDASGEIARRYAAGDRRCRYFRQENAGSAAARNRGIEEARGALVAFLDADDLYAPEKIARQLAVLRQARGEAAVLTGIRRFMVVDGRKTDLNVTAVPELPANNPLPALLGLGAGQMAIFTTALVPKDCLLRAGGYNPRLSTAEDWDLWLRLAGFCSFPAIQEPLYLYRKAAGTRTANEDLDTNLRTQVHILRRAAAGADIQPGALRRAERGRYLEHVRARIYYRDFRGALRLLLEGCRESSLFLEKQFPGLCLELLAKRLGIG